MLGKAGEFGAKQRIASIGHRLALGGAKLEEGFPLVVAEAFRGKKPLARSCGNNSPRRGGGWDYFLRGLGGFFIKGRGGIVTVCDIHGVT